MSKTCNACGGPFVRFAVAASLIEYLASEVLARTGFGFDLEKVRVLD
jgi:hypothetical protein